MPLTFPPFCSDVFPEVLQRLQNALRPRQGTLETLQIDRKVLRS